ncbi:MAG: Flp family type IVb pilin [Candidatus Deferrimicrobiaceae bacterium]
MFHHFLEIFRDEEGQGLVEYALIIMLVALVVFGILTTLGANVTTVFSTISSKFAGS